MALLFGMAFMFTGLIEDIGTIRRLVRAGQDVHLEVDTSLPLDEVRLGDSIAVNGACLTVKSIGGGAFGADVSSETLARTGLGGLGAGARVHLERALRPVDRIGGHLVQGHVDGVGTVVEVRRGSGAWDLWVSLPSELLPEVVEKGSIALDGVSLTVNALDGDRIRLTIVPHTTEQTCLGTWSTGYRMNVETDILGKYVRRQLECRATDPGLRKLLVDYGYTRETEK